MRFAPVAFLNQIWFWFGAIVVFVTIFIGQAIFFSEKSGAPEMFLLFGNLNRKMSDSNEDKCSKTMDDMEKESQFVIKTDFGFEMGMRMR